MTMDLMSPHVYRMGPHTKFAESEGELGMPEDLRRQIEPWLTAVFQTEHLSLLLGSGFTAGICTAAAAKPATMATCELKSGFAEKVAAHAAATAERMGRGAPNIEDQIRAAIQLRDGLVVMGDGSAKELVDALDLVLGQFLRSLLQGERALLEADQERRLAAEDLLMSFLMTFASRTATRERLNIFTTNYDRFAERGCDLAGLHVIDRFVGTLSPVFRSSRLSIDIHYNPPGMRGEPRYLEGVVRLSKLHGSLDWRWEEGELRRCALPFGADGKHPAIPASPSESVMIYPNPAKDTETLEYPYAELFRDFAAGICRPNSSLVTYGYGFGDDHINRIIKDMLTIPSTHLVIIAWSPAVAEGGKGDQVDPSRTRIAKFCQSVGKDAQISLLLGSHCADLQTLVGHYLPKPAIDLITIRRTRLLEQRGQGYRSTDGGETDEQSS